jgi:hypothetical protein
MSQEEKSNSSTVDVDGLHPSEKALAEDLQGRLKRIGRNVPLEDCAFVLLPTIERHRRRGDIVSRWDQILTEAVYLAAAL